MESVNDSRVLPDRSIDERSMHELTDGRAFDELTKLIRKLRWIGETDEAHRLERRLHLAHLRACLVAEPRETD